MGFGFLEFCYLRVALLAEGVDRNLLLALLVLQLLRRPPRGGRG